MTGVQSPALPTFLNTVGAGGGGALLAKLKRQQATEGSGKRSNVAF